MDLQLTGKRAIVTGSTRGIGLAIAHRLAAEGADVAICSRNQTTVDETLAAFSDYSGNIVGSAVDVSDPVAFQSWINSMNEQLGGIDIFVANVTGGGGKEGQSQWQTAAETDILGTVSGINAVLPMLKQSEHGSIVYISSMAGIIGTPQVPAYGAAKAAMTHYMKTLSMMLVSDGVRVNVVAPGDIITEGNVWDRVRINKPDMFKEVLKRNPRGRLGSPQEIANVVTFVASPMGSLVNGTHIVVDGGSTTHVHF